MKKHWKYQIRFTGGGIIISMTLKIRFDRSVTEECKHIFRHQTEEWWRCNDFYINEWLKNYYPMELMGVIKEKSRVEPLQIKNNNECLDLIHQNDIYYKSPFIDINFLEIMFLVFSKLRINMKNKHYDSTTFRESIYKALNKNKKTLHKQLKPLRTKNIMEELFTSRTL